VIARFHIVHDETTHSQCSRKKYLNELRLTMPMLVFWAVTSRGRTLRPVLTFLMNILPASTVRVPALRPQKECGNCDVGGGSESLRYKHADFL
jgi:hypothetical protein